MNVQLLIMFVSSIGAAVVARRRGARAWVFGFAAFALLPLQALIRTTNPFLLSALGLLFAGWLWQRHGRTMATVVRWGASSRRKAGVASSLDIARHAGTIAMRRRARIVRPSLRSERWQQRVAQLATLPPIEVSVALCRVGMQWVRSAIEDVVVVFGGPRNGKTQWLAGLIIDAPGAVLATSTRTDLVEQTSPLRREKGPVYVFNPVGLGLLKSTITFDPLTGCRDAVTAAERAADMIAAASWDQSGDRQFWDDLGRANLAAFLHAAALGDLTMMDVRRWVANPDGHESQILSLLSDSPEPAFESAVVQFIGTNERTRSSITSTISPALAWLTHGPARAASMGGHPFDVADLLASRATVFMLGGEEAQVAPLVVALTGHVAREARRLAALQPGGRLDPPLSLRLDEAALICPIPLHQWSSDMGGRGVSIVACFQSRAQVIDRYGPAKAATIINNAGGKVLFGGTSDRDDLTFWSTLAGDRDEPVTTTDMNGRVASRTVRRVPVLAPSQLAALPPERVVVYRRGMQPIVGRAEQAFRRFDVRRVHEPDAYTVRARIAIGCWAAWLAAQLAEAAGWIAATVRRWWAVVARWLAVWRIIAARRLAAVRVRVTGVRPTSPELAEHLAKLRELGLPSSIPPPPALPPATDAPVDSPDDERVA